jgi:peptidoglycan-associated lipoprotein
MTTALRIAVLAGGLVSGAACRTPPPIAAPQPPTDVVVLAAHPDGGALGTATVSSGGATAQLTVEGHAVDVRAGQPMPAPRVMPAAEITSLFGDVLAAIPPAARRFLLYFELGSNTLTPESRALVPEILAVVSERGQPDVSVVGHTDTTGASAANVELGMRRATLVRELLVTAGLTPGLIEVASHGESNPVEPTPDNTENARNRRVEVTVR